MQEGGLKGFHWPVAGPSQGLQCLFREPGPLSSPISEAPSLKLRARPLLRKGGRLGQKQMEYGSREKANSLY